MNKRNDIGVNAKGLATLADRDKPTKEQIVAGRELCEALPGLMRKAIDAGLPATAHAIQQAVQHVGYEHGKHIEAIS